MFTHDKITSIEVDIIDACGLRCPVCSRNSKTTSDNLRGSTKYISLEKNISIFNKFKNLQHVSFVGTRSESTLYPHLIAFIEYLKSRDVQITISTNGNSKSVDWWNDLGSSLTACDEVRFAIDGSTQEIYSHYRIGGNLEKVLEHHKSFKQSSECTTTLQFIQFKYNEADLDNIRKMRTAHRFDKLLLGHGSYTMDGRQEAAAEEFIDGNFNIEDFHPPKDIYKKYKLIESSYGKSNNVSIECTSYANDEIFINHLGQYSICCFHNGEMLRQGQLSGDMDFVNEEHEQKVKQNKYAFCLTNCNQICKSIISDLVDDE